MNEDAAFERLKDLQREMENNRLIARSTLGFASTFRNWASVLGGSPAWRCARRAPEPFC